MADTPESPPRPSRWRRVALVVGLGLAVALVGLRLWLPEWLRTTLEREAEASLGREVTVGGLDLSLLPTRLAIQDASIGAALGEDADPESPIALGSLAITIDPWALLREEVELLDVEAEGLVLRLERDAAGDLAPLSLVPDEPDPEPTAPWPVRVRTIRVADATVQLLRAGAEAEPEIDFQLDALRSEALVFRDGVVTVGDVAFQGPRLALGRSSTEPAEPSGETASETASRDVEAADEALVAHRIEALAIEDAELALQVRDGKPLTLVLNFTARDVGPQAPFPVTLAVESEGGRLDLSGNLAMAPPAFQGELAWSALPLPRLLEASGAELDAQLDSGRSEGRLAVDLAMGQALTLEGTARFEALDASTDDASLAAESIRLDLEQLQVPLDGARDNGVAVSGVVTVAALDASTGDTEVAAATLELDLDRVDLQLRDGAAAEVELAGSARVGALDAKSTDTAFAAPSLALDLTRARVPLAAAAGPLEIHLARIDLDAPDVRLLRTREEASSPPSAAEAARPAPRVRVDAFDVAEGRFRFEDTTVRGPFRTQWRDIVVTGQGLRWPEQDVRALVVRAKGPGGARLRVDGDLRKGQGEITSGLDRLALAPLDPYAEEFTGIALEGGRVQLRSKLALGDTIRTQSTVDLQQAELSERESGWFEKTLGMPLEVALALLRDLNGNITLPIDAEIRPDESRVGWLSLLGGTLRQALIGAISSPLKVVGGLADAAGEVLTGGRIPAIRMDPGQVSIEADAVEARLASLADTLRQKPTLQLVLRGGSDPSDDPVLARRLVAERAREGTLVDGHGLGLFERGRVREVLAEVPADQDPSGLDPESETALSAMASGIAVSAEQRTSLARARAEAVRQVLLEEHDLPADAVALAPDVVADTPGVAVMLAARPAEDPN